MTIEFDEGERTWARNNDQAERDSDMTYHSARDWYNINDWVKFDDFTFNNLSELWEYVQGLLNFVYQSDESPESKAFSSLAIMRRFSETVYDKYKESI